MPKQSIPIELGGKTKHLRYGFKALVALEDALGIPLSELESIFPKKGEKGSFKMKDIVTFIWAGLIHEDKELTTDGVIDLLDDTDLSALEILDKVIEAFDQAFPEETTDEKNSKSQAQDKKS